MFLYSAVRRLAGQDAILWIDTLSVPIEAEFKRIAISKLRDIYQGASHVLVIDKDLMQVGNDKVEQIMHLLSSEWQQRLWTLQEGRLTHELYIQFKNGPIAVSELSASLRLCSSNPSTGLFNFFDHLVEDLRDRFTSTENITERFQKLIVDLAPRSVTVSSDEPVCLATLLGLRVENFDSYPTMVDIYRSLPAVPQDLIFLDQPRLKEPGLTWAPASFLETEFVHFPYHARAGRLNLEGLEVEVDCVILDNNFILQRDQNSLSAVYILNTPVGGKLAVESPDFYSADGLSITREQARTISNAAILWMKPLTTSWNTSKAILVSQIEESESHTTCVFEMLLFGWRPDGYSPRSQKWMSTRITTDISGEFVGAKKFCIV